MAGKEGRKSSQLNEYLVDEWFYFLVCWLFLETSIMVQAEVQFCSK